MVARSGHVLFFVALSVWVGGMVALGALAAPALFRHLPSGQAGTIFGAILRRFAYVELACGVVALTGASMTYAATRHWAVFSWIRIVALTAMLLISAGATFGVNPKVARLRDVPGEEARREFDRLHGTSERLALLNVLLGTALLAVSAWTHSRD